MLFRVQNPAEVLNFLHGKAVKPPSSVASSSPTGPQIDYINRGSTVRVSIDLGPLMYVGE
jgi:hypothetical protein